MPLNRRKFVKQIVGTCVSLQIVNRGIAGISLTELIPILNAHNNNLKVPTTWGINTNIDTWQRYASSPAEAINNIIPLILNSGCSIIREGMQSNLNGNDNDSIDWKQWFDPLVDKLDELGMQLILQMNINEVKNPQRIYDKAWEDRVKHKCLTVANYVNSSNKRRRTIAWFLLMNEPDQPTSFSKVMSPEILVKYHKLAWESIKSVNPDFMIEGYSFAYGAGAGGANPLQTFNLGTEGNPQKFPVLSSKSIFDLGGSLWCDFIGFHNYNRATEENPFGAKALITNMENAYRKKNYPLRPIVVSETGCHDYRLNADGIKNSGVNLMKSPDEKGWAAIAHWQQLNRVYIARWGVSRSFFYSLGGSGASWMNVVDYPMKQSGKNGTAPAKVPPYTKRPSYNSAVTAMGPKYISTLNGGFEKAEDKFSNWMVCYNPLDFHSKDYEYGEWKEAHFITDGAHTAPGSPGIGYLKLEPGLPKLVRRIVEGLKNAVAYKVTAWIKQETSAKATLAVYGFDQNKPSKFTSASTTKQGEWVKLTTTFITQRSLVGVDSWCVISIEHNGLNTAYWDDVSIELV